MILRDPPPIPQSVLPPTPPPPPQPKTPGQFFDAALAVTLQFARASARGWTTLDWWGRLFVVCGGFATAALLGLAIGGSSRATDPRIAEAYEVHHRFVDAYVHSLGLYSFSGFTVRFSPPDQTRIVRSGNYFRIRGWFAMSDDNTAAWGYMCNVELDPELDVWHLVGSVEQIGRQPAVSQ